MVVRRRRMRRRMRVDTERGEAESLSKSIATFPNTVVKDSSGDDGL